jgi:hypothetical protein
MENPWNRVIAVIARDRVIGNPEDRRKSPESPTSRTIVCDRCDSFISLLAFAKLLIRPLFTRR